VITCVMRPIRITVMPVSLLDAEAEAAMVVPALGRVSGGLG
jgi:hypothetical protein